MSTTAKPVQPEETVRAVPPISTGNEEIDKRLGGGLPRYSLSLVEGQSDAGKSVLLQHLCWGVMTGDEPVALYTTENTVRSLLRQMASLGMDATDYFLLQRFRILPVHPDGPAPTDALWALLAHMERSTTPVLLIDSLTSMMTRARDSEIVGFFAGCKRLCDRGTSIVLSAHASALEPGTLVRVRSLCDAHLHLRIEQVGEQLVKVLEVAKVRGAARNTGSVVSFDVEPGLGMRLIPVSKAKV